MVIRGWAFCKIPPASSIDQLITAAGQAELGEHLTAEWDVAASIPRTRLKFRALKKV